MSCHSSCTSCRDDEPRGSTTTLRWEIAEFNNGFSTAFQVKPGMTGLWQVEARDKSSFEAYRRLRPVLRRESSC